MRRTNEVAQSFNGKNRSIAKSLNRLWPVLLLGAWLCGCARKDAPEVVHPEKADYTSQAQMWADSVAAGMSDQELVGQLLMPALYASADSATLAQLAQYADSLHVGGVMLLKGDTASVSAITAELRRLSPIPPLVAIDAEWGLGMRLRDAPSYTPFSRLPDSITDVRMYDYGYALGLQARRLGLNVVFGPVLDVASVPGSAMAYRSLGSDPERVTRLGLAYARGLEDASVISVAKHFPGLGGTRLDSHRAMPVSASSRKMLDSLDLYPFRQYVREGLGGVMVGHIAVPVLDTVLRSAVVSPMIVNDLLRKDMDFSGLIFTDAMNMRGLGSVEQPSVQAILAGADILVAPPDTHAAAAELLQAMKSGSLPRDVVHGAVSRILFYKYPRQEGSMARGNCGK